MRVNECLTVSIADDHAMVLRGLSDLLAQQPDFAVVACSQEGDAALNAIREYRPRIALIDFHMPKRNGLSILADVRREGFSTSIVFFTAGLSDVDLFDAVNAGAAGIILKEMAPEALLECLREVARGNPWTAPTSFEPTLMRESRRREKWREHSVFLTARELEIVTSLAERRS